MTKVCSSSQLPGSTIIKGINAFSLGRPCQRCIKKGCQDTCRDGVRKQAKYLMDVPPPALNPLSTNSSHVNPTVQIYSSMILPNNNRLNQGKQQILLPPSPPDALKNHNGFDVTMTNPSGTASGPALTAPNASIDFSSRAADLEYLSITNMLGDIDKLGLSLFKTTPASNPNTNAINNLPEQPTQNFNASLTASLIDTPPNSEYSPASTYPPLNTNGTEVKPIDPPKQFKGSKISSISTPVPYDTPEQVYSMVTAPYPYTNGYHSLISYLRSRFEKPQLMVLARSMAAYRPSFIATTKTLQEDDLIFMEKCFQRTLLEFQKFITSSGTPTGVWRRPGQIAAAGWEFCILTGWKHSDLVRAENPRFIMELMDDTSVTKYFDVFTTLAFGDSRGVIMTECTLLKPTGEPVRTACTWTVKRDVFDIPMMIIGNFLPILD